MSKEGVGQANRRGESSKLKASAELKRIGVLTGGGDAPGLNAVIRAVVKSAARAGIEVMGVKDGYAGLIHGLITPLEPKAVSGILPRGGTILGTSNRDNPFRYPIQQADQVEFRDVSGRVFENVKKHGLQALVVIGGDGSLTIANQFWKLGLPVVGVPKTIDNDLSATDQTFGFDTALETATQALDKLHTTAESHHRVMVMEVMGRYAGWIALEAGLAGGAHVILIPEIPFTVEKVAEKVKERRDQGKRFTMVVVAEGAYPKGGEMVVQRRVEKSHDPIRLGGIANVLGGQIEQITGVETRATVLGHLQRGGSPTPFDRILGTRLGVAAVEAVVRGDFGQMVGLRGIDVGMVTLDEAIGQLKKVDPDGELVRVARAIGTSFGDELS